MTNKHYNIPEKTVTMALHGQQVLVYCLMSNSANRFQFTAIKVQNLQR